MTTTLNTAEVCDYGSRTAVIEVKGLCRQKIMRTSNYIVKVPYGQMSETIQRIIRTGGKISGVKIASFNLGNSNNTDSLFETKSESKVVVVPGKKETNTKKTKIKETQTEKTPIEIQKELHQENNSIPEIESSKYLSNFEDNPQPVVTKTKGKKKSVTKQKTSKRKRKN
ncbi:MAG: phycobilisome linker polypeptide [Cyanobacteria bacterium P01_A01_bin.84]